MTAPRIELPDGHVDLARLEVHRSGRTATLTRTEGALLRALAAGGTASPVQLAAAEGLDRATPRSIEVAVRRLRAKIEQDPKHPTVLLTVYGQGYRLAPVPPGGPPLRETPAVRLVLGDRWIDLRSGAISTGGTLTRTELAVLRALNDAPDAEVSAADLARQVWGARATHGRPYVAMAGLRAKVEADPDEPQWILTVHGRGWRLRRTPSRTNLSPDLTSFVGRASELAALIERIDASRLVTISGPAGVGKSRLAREALRAVTGRWEGGTWWVEAGAVRTPNGLLLAIAEALGATVAGTAAQVESAVLDRLVGVGPVVLALDNLEQIADAGPLVERLAKRAPRARIVATSRHRLDVTGEHLFRLEPLGADDARDLFLARARLVVDGLALSEDALGQLDRGLVALDRLPLSIELAASRADVFEPAALADRIDPLDPSPSSEVSLRRALDGSWRLLEPALRHLLSAATLFAVPFEPAALAATSGAAPGEIDRLVRRSMLQSVDTPRGTRLRMLIAVRAYVAERLPASEAVRQAAAAWFAARAAELSAKRGGREAARAVAALRAHAEDWVASVSHASEAQTVTLVDAILDAESRLPDELALRLVHGALERFPTAAPLWRARAGVLRAEGDLPGAHAALDRAVALGLDPADPRLLRLRYGLAHDVNDPEAMRAAVGPRPEGPVALDWWLEESARLAELDGQRPRAYDLLLEALSVARRFGTRREEQLLVVLATTAIRGADWERAFQWAEESVVAARISGEPHATRTSLLVLAGILRQSGDPEGAARRLEEMERVGVEHPHRAERHVADQLRAWIAFRRGEYRRASDAAHASIHSAGSCGAPQLWPMHLLAACAAIALREWDRARTIAEAAPDFGPDPSLPGVCVGVLLDVLGGRHPGPLPELRADSRPRERALVEGVRSLVEGRPVRVEAGPHAKDLEIACRAAGLRLSDAEGAVLPMRRAR